MTAKTYTPQQIRSLVEAMRGIYPIVRLVDPEECRELEVDDNGTVRYMCSCYSVWGACQRCSNCVSFRSCHTQETMSKAKRVGGKNYRVTSTPVRIQTPQASILCNLEMGTVEVEVPPETDVPAEPGGLPPQEEEDVNSFEYLLTHDMLTRLLSTEGFYRAAREELKDNPDLQFVIVAANARRFKVFNALYGRAHGDSVLIKLADLLRQRRTEHTLFARDPSEGFIMLAPRSVATDQRIWEFISVARKRFSQTGFRFSVHVGIYDIVDPNLPMSVMVDRAIMAMRSTRDSSVHVIARFDEAMLQEEVHEHVVVSTFDRVMREGRFRMYLQPQFRASSTEDGRAGDFLGAEALVRAYNEDGSVVSPARFIGILEKSDQIAKLDRFIWESAVERLASWEDHPVLGRAYISVNVSPRDLYTMDVAQVLSDLCQKHGVPAGRLHVEITETSVLDDIASRARNIEHLQHAGFLVEIDDFGKGSSSLAMLGHSSADVLKIDKAFLAEIQTSDKSLKIVQSVIKLTREIGMECVAEGVETEDQAQILRRMGCDVFQGFLYARPMLPEEVERVYG